MKYFHDVISYIIALVLGYLWLVGISIAAPKGFWNTLFAFFPFYAWYLVVEKTTKYIPFFN